MDSPPPSLQPLRSPNDAVLATASGDCNPIAEVSLEPPNGGNSTNPIKKKKAKNKKKKNPIIDVSDQQSSSSSTCCYTTSHRGGFQVSGKNRNPRRAVIGSFRQKESDVVEALALPLGMSIAAVLSQVFCFHVLFLI